MPTGSKCGPHIRLWATIVAVVGVVLWVGTLLFEVSYFGTSLTVYYGDGCIGLYSGGTPELRNSMVLNNFTWPYFSTGAGTEWDADRWGRVMTLGPDLMLSWPLLSQRLRYPQRFGLYWPGVSFTAAPHYLGVPFWSLIAAGVSLRLVLRHTRQARQCFLCGYDLAGNTTGVCPECGKGKGSESASGVPDEPGTK